MRRVAYLPKLQRNALKRLTLLREVLDPAAIGSDPRDLDRRVAHVTLEVDNVWSGFCRSFYLSCALGARDANGKLVVGVQRFQTEDRALAFAIHLFNAGLRHKFGPWQAREEPSWHEVNSFDKIMRQLSPSNLAEVQRALGVPTTAFANLRTFRNFYAHRNVYAAERTRRAAPRLKVSSVLHPTQVLSSSPPGVSDTILRDWIADLRIVVGIMA